MVRTRFAPSPTGYMHIGNLRTALYEYLVAKTEGGKFILRIEDTDQQRLVEGSDQVIYNTLKIAKLQYDEGPDVGGPYGPYIQSERQNCYLEYAKKLIDSGHAYYCFCTKERLNELVGKNDKDIAFYDRHCHKLSQEEIDKKLADNTPYVIRQLIPEGKTTFHDEVYGSITVENSILEDQILIKTDGLPTYNFANVVDDHLMYITHIVRGSEYLSSTPKYNLLYEAFGWEIPVYIHLPPVMNSEGGKLSKRKGDASFEDLLEMGYLPDAIINFIALLGWSPGDTREFFTLAELEKAFSVKGISKSPSVFDMVKLTWMNGEYFKRMSDDEFYELSRPYLEESVIRKDIDLKTLSNMLKTRVNFAKDVTDMVVFINEYNDYDLELFTHKKMKTTVESSKQVLTDLLPLIEEADFDQESIEQIIKDYVEENSLKNGQVLWPLRTALSGQPTSPCGAVELLFLLGKDESLRRLKITLDRM